MPSFDHKLNRNFYRAFSRLVRPSLLCFCLLGVVLIGCGASVDDAESGPTVDVKPGLDVSTEDDVVEVRYGTGLSGILPGDFPGDVPLVLPASLVNFGVESGDAYVELTTAKGRQAVEQGMVGLLQDRGWDLVKSVGDGSPNEMRLVKDQRSLRVVFLPSDSGSTYRIVY